MTTKSMAATIELWSGSSKKIGFFYFTSTTIITGK